MTAADGVEFRPEVAVSTGAPHDQILEYATAHDIDLIVMGSHGRGTIGKLMMGSTAEHVVHRAHCPVLVFRQPRGD